MKQILVIVVTLLLLCSIALGGLLAPPKPPVADIYMTAGNGTHSNAWDLGDRVAVNCLIITHVTGTWTFEVAVQPLHWDHACIEHTEGRDLIKLVDKNNLVSLYTADKFDEPRLFISGLTNEVLSLSDRLGEAFFEVDLLSGEVVPTNDPGTP